MSVINIIKNLDETLFHVINNDFSNSFFDALLPFLRESFFWIPLYFFLLVFSLNNFGVKGWWWILSMIILISISDYLSSSILKDQFARIRPCNEPGLTIPVRFIVNYCPKSFSFTSSHAVNHFTAAMFIFTTLKSFGKYWGWIFAWAAIICFAQVYVGVHYPIDVAGGALLGCILGWAAGKIFNKNIELSLI